MAQIGNYDSAQLAHRFAGLPYQQSWLATADTEEGITLRDPEGPQGDIFIPRNWEDELELWHGRRLTAVQLAAIFGRC
jgi:hypothetical protein